MGFDTTMQKYMDEIRTEPATLAKNEEALKLLFFWLEKMMGQGMLCWKETQDPIDFSEIEPEKIMKEHIDMSNVRVDSEKMESACIFFLMKRELRSLLDNNVCTQYAVYIATGKQTYSIGSFLSEMSPYKISKNNQFILKLGTGYITTSQQRETVAVEGKEISAIPFSEWFDRYFCPGTLTPEEEMRIGRLIRYPGGNHEWLKVSQLNKIKQLGIPGKYIRTYVTPTKECRFWMADKGKMGIHGGEGSTQMHKTLDLVYQQSDKISALIQNLNWFYGIYYKNYSLEDKNLLALIEALKAKDGDE